MSINSATGLISVTLSLVSSPAIESVIISYIIYDTNSPISYNLFSVSQGSTSPYQLIGIDSIQSGSTVLAGNGFSSASQNGIGCVGSRCTVNCVTSQACIAASGVITNSVCYMCLTGQIVSNGQCLTTTSCGLNKHYDSTTSSCVCNTGYALYNSVCYISCGPNAIIINNQCSCLPGYTYSQTLKQCSRQTVACPLANYVRVNGVCVCPSPYGLINTICLTCPTNGYVNQAGNCACVSGYTLNPSTRTCLLSCFANAYRNTQGNCVCISGYHLQGGQCIPQGSCTGGLVWSGTACVCPSPQITDSITNQCTYCNTIGRTVSNGVCVCSSTYYPTQTTCSPCIANSHYSSSQLSCICDTNYIMSNGQCIVSVTCPLNSNWNQSQQTCVCVATNQYVINGYCQACVINSHYDAASISCVCDTGYAMSGGVCTTSCVNSTWNGNTCVCWSGYYIISGVCRQCDVNSHYSNTAFTCVCNDGYYGTWSQCSACSSTCLTCSGPNTNQCISCPSNSPLNGVCTVSCVNSTWNGSTCICWAGYNLINGACQQCDVNSVYSASAATCICNNGYFGTWNQCSLCASSCVTCSGPGTNQCTSCSTGNPVNGVCPTTCVNATWNGSACVCWSGYNLINGVCQVCDVNSAYSTSAATCICNTGYYGTWNLCSPCDSSCLTCSGPSSNQCNSCKPNATWNGSTCICWSGFNFINGACQQCDVNSVYSASAATCICNNGYYGTWNQCNLCDSTCLTCSGPATNECTTCASGAPISGVCSTTCIAGQYVLNNVCVACTPNCILCYTGTSCAACDTGYTSKTLGIGSAAVTTCELPSSSATHVLTLRGNVLGNGIIYQGVALNLMPSAILGAGCSICNNLLKIEVNSLFSAITVTQQYITGSVYWFAISFAYSSSFVPTFQYTIRIDPIHAAFFTSHDLAQVLQGSFSSSSFSTAAAVAVPTSSTTTSSARSSSSNPTAGSSFPSTTILSPFATGGSASTPPSTTPSTSTVLSQATIDALFN